MLTHKSIVTMCRIAIIYSKLEVITNFTQKFQSQDTSGFVSP